MVALPDEDFELALKIQDAAHRLGVQAKGAIDGFYARPALEKMAEAYRRANDSLCAWFDKADDKDIRR